MSHPLFTKKPLQMLLDEAAGENRLRRCLGPITLTSLGVGAIIGTGIFVLTGIAAHDKTGPALILSFVVAGLACIFAALCYAEFASLTPVAGSAYTYAYATLGELFAWIMGWDLVLEYSVSSAAVAHGWSHYFQNFIGIFGLKIPFAMSRAPFDYYPETGLLATTGTYFDLPAIIITAIIAALLVKGIKESATVNSTIVIIKVSVVIMVIIIGVFYIDPANWKPFAPYGYAGISIFGNTILGQTGMGGEPLGMLAGAAMIFFAYIGFDSLSTHAEEARNPKKDIPIGIISSLVLCTILYMGVAFVLTGMVPSDRINIDAPVADAFAQRGLHFVQFIISIGAIAGITSVLLVMMLSQPRILLAIARDGMIPSSFFGAVHPKFRTPWKSTILTGIFVAFAAGFLPLRILAELVNIGTLLAFMMVSAAVLIMRQTHPNAERSFKTPLYPWVPILGILSSLLLMFSLPVENWLRLGIWLAVGLLIYLGYGRRHSVMRKAIGQQSMVNSQS
jgi:APA family basic amino acid/polyamine antiporter